MINLLAGEAISAWKEDEAARAKRARSAFLARIGSLVTQREAKMDVLRQRRYSLERQIDQVGTAKRNAAAEVRRVLAAGRVPVPTAREPRLSPAVVGSPDPAATAAGATIMAQYIKQSLLT